MDSTTRNAVKDSLRVGLHADVQVACQMLVRWLPNHMHYTIDRRSQACKLLHPPCYALLMPCLMGTLAKVTSSNWGRVEHKEADHLITQARAYGLQGGAGPAGGGAGPAGGGGACRGTWHA